MELANEMNNDEAQIYKTIEVVAANPGPADSTLFRKITSLEPNVSIFLLNELQAKKESIMDPATWPNNYTAIANESCPDGLIYTCILYKNSISHLIKETKCAGIATGIDLECERGSIKRFISTYRHNNKKPPDCFYYKNYQSDKMLFVEWIADHIAKAKKDAVLIHIAGDWNINLENERTEDNHKMCEELLNLTKNLTNLVQHNTHFRQNTKPSKIDYFWVQKPEQTSIRALGWHLAPANFDGHTAHSAKIPFGLPLRQYEVRISRKIDHIAAFEQAIKEYGKWAWETTSNPKIEERINRKFDIINELFKENSETTAKIKKNESALKKTTPRDTWLYRQAARQIEEEINKRPGEEEIVKYLKVELIRVSVMCKKLFARDSINRANAITEKASGRDSSMWEVVNELTKTPPIREIKDTTEELMSQVLELEKATTADEKDYKGHTFEPRHNVKLSEFKIKLHGSEHLPSFLAEYKALKPHTKGSTGINRAFLDRLPICYFEMFVFKPVEEAILNGCYPAAWRTSRTCILDPKEKTEDHGPTGANKDDCAATCFADDTLISIAAPTITGVVEKAEKVYRVVNKKMKDLGLQLVGYKTNCIILGKEGIEKDPSFEYPKTMQCETDTVKFTQNMKYLGSLIGEINHKFTLDHNTTNVISAMNSMTNRTRSLHGYIDSKSLKDVQRANAMGCFSHNAEVTPKWKANEYARGINTYVRGLNTNINTKWFYAKNEEYDIAKKREKLSLLKNSGHPTLFESKLSLFCGLLNRTMRVGKAQGLKQEAMQGIWVTNAKTGDKISKLPDLFETDREIEKRKYFEREFKWKYPQMTDQFKGKHHVNNIIKLLLIRNVLTLEIIPPKKLSKECKAMIWPYTLADDFNSLPTYVKGSVFASSMKNTIKPFLANNHKHMKQSLACEICLTGQARNIPKYMTNINEKMIDSTENKEIKKLARLDIASHTTKAINSIIKEVVWEICKVSSIGRKITEIWEEMANPDTEITALLIIKLIAIRKTLCP
ncbi:unnamed protein product [Oikopleura dioica]|uniref:Uncharacterized protein n=1 Tax=Oikopleura dioica TaxID=34765 RepID=E4XUW2_OIKDI|nr:unnamed protein product [Oikopleura dioica]